MNESESFRITYITFLECEVRGGWVNVEDLGMKTKASEAYFKVWKEPAEILLVRPDGLRRNFLFKNESEVAVHSGMIAFKQKDLIDELSVDDSKKFPEKKRIDE